MSYRKLRGVAAVTVGSVLLLSACSSSSKAASSPGTTGSGGTTGAQSASGSGSGLSGTITIGAPLDLSGSAAIATVGPDELKGEQMAVKEVNSSHFLGAAQIKLDSVDTQASQALAVQTVTSMVNNKDTAIVGFSLSPSFLAAGPLAQKAGVPVMAVGLSGTGITEVGDHVFRVYPALTTLYQRTDPGIVQALGAKTAAYFYDNDSSNTTEQHDYRQKLLEGMGIKTVASESTTSNAISYQTQLTAIKAAHPDVVVVNLNGGQDPTFAQQAKQAGLSVPIMGDIGWGAPNVISQPGAQCAIFTTTWDSSMTAGKNPQFVSNYQAEYHTAPSQYAAWGYDGIWLMATGIKNAGSTSQPAIRDALASLKNFSGALGVYGFDSQRDPTQNGVVLQINGGKTVDWTPSTKCQL